NELIARQVHEYHRVLEKDNNVSEAEMIERLTEYAISVRYVLYLRNKLVAAEEGDEAQAAKRAYINQVMINDAISPDAERVQREGGLKRSFELRSRRRATLLNGVMAELKEKAIDVVSPDEYRADLTKQFKANTKPSKPGLMGIVDEVVPLAQPFLD